MDLVDFFEKFIKIVTRYWDVFLIKGLSTTLALSAIAVFFGAIIGTLLAFGKMGKSRILRGIITAYVEIIRGTPSLLQVYVGYFVVPLLLPSLNVSTYASVAIALTINSSAYVSEVIRSGIQAVDKGQTEAARSLGLTRSQAMIKVVLPQAVKNILPALGNLACIHVLRGRFDDKLLNRQRQGVFAAAMPADSRHNLFHFNVYTRPRRKRARKETEP